MDSTRLRTRRQTKRNEVIKMKERNASGLIIFIMAMDFMIMSLVSNKNGLFLMLMTFLSVLGASLFIYKIGDK